MFSDPFCTDSYTVYIIIVKQCHSFGIVIIKVLIVMIITSVVTALGCDNNWLIDQFFCQPGLMVSVWIVFVCVCMCVCVYVCMCVY